MKSFPAAAPERGAPILAVGRDLDGGGLVQEGLGSVHGRFVSFDEALSFAPAARHGFTGEIIATSCALVAPVMA